MSWKRTTSALLSNVFWISIIIGLLLLWASTSFFTDSRYVGISEKMGLTVLSSGVFAVILKSFQFTGLFREEIEKVILSSKFLEKRNDLPELWKLISSQIYKQKFPEINEDLQSIILDEYFPVSHKVYYENLIFTINIEEITDNIIKFTQTVYIKGKKQDDANIDKLKKCVKVEQSQNPENYKFEKLRYRINGKDIALDTIKGIEKIDDRGDKTIETEIPIGNGKIFEIETKERREYSIKDDNTKLFHVNYITKELQVSVSHPENVKVLFFPLGVVKPFTILHEDHPNRITRIHREGLILPYQGFGLTFDTKE